MPFAFGFSLDFLFEIAKLIGVEKLTDRNIQPVTDFLDGCDRGAVIATADDIVQGRLGNTTHGGQLVDRDVMLTAQLQNSLLHCFANVQTDHPSFGLFNFILPALWQKAYLFWVFNEVFRTNSTKI